MAFEKYKPRGLCLEFHGMLTGAGINIKNQAVVPARKVTLPS